MNPVPEMTLQELEKSLERHKNELRALVVSIEKNKRDLLKNHGKTKFYMLESRQRFMETQNRIIGIKEKKIAKIELQIEELRTGQKLVIISDNLTLF